MNKRVKVALIAVVAILMTLITTQTLAYYTTIGKATNVVTSGDIALKIHEKTDTGEDFPAEGVTVIPGDQVSKIVTIENTCGHPFYLRVKLVNTSDSAELVAEECLKVDLNTADWTQGTDGFIYYNRVLQPGEVTQPVFTQVEVIGSAVDRENIGSTLALTVKAYAVQSAHNSAEHPWDAAGWPAE